MKTIDDLNVEGERKDGFEDLEGATPDSPLTVGDIIAEPSPKLNTELTDLELETMNTNLTGENMDNDSKKSQTYSPNRQAKYGKKISNLGFYQHQNSTC